MIPVYQTRLPKLAKTLRGLGFKYTLKNKIYEFVYSKELGAVLEELRDEHRV